MLFFPIVFPDHYVNRAGATVVFLCRMESENVVQLRQPLRQVALELGDAIRIAFSLAVQDDHRADVPA